LLTLTISRRKEEEEEEEEEVPGIPCADTFLVTRLRGTVNYQM